MKVVVFCARSLFLLISFVLSLLLFCLLEILEMVNFLVSHNVQKWLKKVSFCHENSNIKAIFTMQWKDYCSNSFYNFWRENSNRRINVPFPTCMYPAVVFWGFFFVKIRSSCRSVGKDLYTVFSSKTIFFTPLYTLNSGQISRSLSWHFMETSYHSFSSFLLSNNWVSLKQKGKWKITQPIKWLSRQLLCAWQYSF